MEMLRFHALTALSVMILSIYSSRKLSVCVRVFTPCKIWLEHEEFSALLNFPCLSQNPHYWLNVESEANKVRSYPEPVYLLTTRDNGVR